LQKQVSVITSKCGQACVIKWFFSVYGYFHWIEIKSRNS
jgi:hypothetical protein